MNEAERAEGGGWRDRQRQRGWHVPQLWGRAWSEEMPVWRQQSMLVGVQCERCLWRRLCQASVQAVKGSKLGWGELYT